MYKNKVSVKVNCYKGFDYNETFDGIKNASLKYVELSTSNGNSINLSQDSSKDVLNRIKEDMSIRNITPIAIGGNSYIMDEDKSKIIKNIELADFFGCKYVDVTVFNARNDSNLIASNKDIAEHIKYYIPFLEKYNLDLVIELHGEYSTARKLNEILNLVNSKHVHINYDTGNALYWGKLSIDEMIEDLKSCIDNVSYMHIKDKLDDNNVWNFPAIGEGYIPFNKIFDIIKEKDDITLCIEIEFTSAGPKDLNEVNQSLVNSVNYIKKFGFSME